MLLKKLKGILESAKEKPLTREQLLGKSIYIQRSNGNIQRVVVKELDVNKQELSHEKYILKGFHRLIGLVQA